MKWRSPSSPLLHIRSFNLHFRTTSSKPRIIHPPDVFSANCLADLHLKRGRIEDALHVLDEIPQPNLISWNLTISCHNRASRFERSLATFREMRSLGFQPNQFTYGSVLSACVASQRIDFGEQVYSIVLKNGFFLNGYVLTGLLDLFSKSGRFVDALKLFLEIDTENVVCWNAVIAGGVRDGETLVSLELFREMVDGICMPNGFTFSSVLNACAVAGELEMGRGIHAWVVKCNAGDDVFVGTAIVDLYAKCGDMDAAVKEFSKMPVRNVVSWTAIISGFSQKEDALHALQFFKEMIQTKVEVNNFTITSVLAACSNPILVHAVHQINCWVLKNGFFTDFVVKNALISAYAKTGHVWMSEEVFKEAGQVEAPNTWSAMISGLVQNNNLRKSIELFQKMFHGGVIPDKFCVASILGAVNCIDLGRQIHSYVVKAGLVSDVLVGCALFTMYSKLDSIDDSHEIFQRMPERDTVAWSSMIAGFAEHGHSEKAFHLFKQMLFEKVSIDHVTLSAVLTAGCSHQFLSKGKEIHAHTLRSGLAPDSLIAGALVSMYTKCKSLISARRIFDGTLHKDQVLWSSMISAYVSNNLSKEALLVFHRMLIAGCEVDHFTCSSVLRVCGNLSKQSLGRQLHAHVIRAGITHYLSVSSALLTMYSKCGSIDDSRKVFDEIESPDLITWTAMMDGYAQHGRGLEALEIFGMMKENGVKPDSVTIVGVLSACSHNGLVDEGFLHFNSMSRDYGIKPELHHYACMVDLLGRSGRLKEAAAFIDKMPIEPDSLVWSTLLGACRVHGDVELGKVAAKKVLELEPCDSGAYISLSNMSADMGNWDEVVRLRSSMKGVGLRKESGWSTV
ncbi:hypothetical protein J5N97_005776 [Dioscorea zingiberensis]|uniref:Pentatricopeptide repeat-containing protein n=1 Tax=Dioscorea zingiberensis TaxID=325984 RepID=A0A9D5HS86_9LILI|nr:hypothetical protein J5N97_005776 [Dioscorea zingiberensis]